MPGLKDDDGNFVAVDKDAGPPPRYPVSRREHAFCCTGQIRCHNARQKWSE